MLSFIYCDREDRGKSILGDDVSQDFKLGCVNLR